MELRNACESCIILLVEHLSIVYINNIEGRNFASHFIFKNCALFSKTSTPFLANTIA